ncbi:aspartate aminotransferase family protein [Paracrocinitomix mangrovi]|uniref:aspartate aminotransferase family protein n=1 Tax=Paracrocinitomix mangrovi TaxID=2862509 RepID=UPI001C8DE0C4|nr:aspartate aminotransferase family protein [Paracrocinitomix mangrovi]UKN02511.1 aspartate aminotransferase family protein [Paracrocinitomix mangrovi]
MDHHQAADKFLNSLGQTSPFPFLIEVDRAEGIYFWDKSGKRYTDMISGVAVNNIGHRHPKVIKAIKDQVDQYLHVMVYGEFIQDSQLKMAEELIATLPENLNSVYAVNSGTEANEAALKLAKRYTGRHELIACKGSYHGNTHGSMSVSYNETKKAPFRPLLPAVKFIEFGEVKDLELITGQTAGVIMETIQGDAGVRIPSKEYMQALRNRCNETGALLIFDEIQCGIGRSGKMHAFEHFGIVPDILTLGKALGGGMPIGAFVANRDVMKVLSDNPILGHITTFGGHPVICAAAGACLEVLREENWIADADRKGQMLEDILLQSPEVKTVRRIGMLFAIDLASADRVQQVVESCLEKGLLTFWFLSHPYSFRLSPPLSISDEQIQEAGNIILEALQETK